MPELEQWELTYVETGQLNGSRYHKTLVITVDAETNGKALNIVERLYEAEIRKSTLVSFHRATNRGTKI